MARIIALDIGAKRTGLAVTDPAHIIATGLTGIETASLIAYLDKYLADEKVEKIVIGKPVQMDNTASESWEEVSRVAEKLRKHFPEMSIEFYDERFTSKIALQSMKMAGAGKKQMKDKHTVDMVSATVILQNYLEHKK